MQLRFISVLLALLLLILGSCKQETQRVTTTTGTTQDTATGNTQQQPEWVKNAVIYEVNVRQFSQEGTLEAVTKQLKRISDMGVDVIWLMPIHPIGELNRKGTLGSYYAIRDYKAVNPEFGTMEDFKQLVSRAHDLGMKVIIDWVANHSSPDNVWIADNLEYYTKDSLGNAPIPTLGTDWTDVADLNYDNPELREAMLDAMEYWVREADIDGYRCDVAEYVPMDFWMEARRRLDAIKPVFLLAEGANPELHQAFNMTYGWPMKDVMIKISDGEKNYAAVKEYFEERQRKFAPNDVLMYFTTNHDENSWNYLEHEQFGENHDNYVKLTFSINGMPLIYNGQEGRLDRKIEFFEKDPIQWHNYERAPFYTKLIKFYKDNEALWNNGRAQYEVWQADADVLFYTVKNNDQKMAVLQNYSAEPKGIATTQLGSFNTTSNAYDGSANVFEGENLMIPAHSTVYLK
ncbi:MAG: alpha-amylase family glycosyl hydrolase [Weeksellaceae bacterium]|nr:alpha-amylase family glycosyl hydrolase [Weeksellaceae bacterium]